MIWDRPAYVGLFLFGGSFKKTDPSHFHFLGGGHDVGVEGHGDGVGAVPKDLLQGFRIHAGFDGAGREGVSEGVGSEGTDPGS